MTTENIKFNPKFMVEKLQIAVHNYKNIIVPEYFEQKYPRGLEPVQLLPMPLIRTAPAEG